VHARHDEAIAIAPSTLHEDGFPAMWVKWEYRLSRRVTGEPDRRAHMQEHYAWVEADCEAGRVRESHHRTFADGQFIPVRDFNPDPAHEA
jgi:hypothetical protein